LENEFRAQEIQSADIKNKNHGIKKKTKKNENTPKDVRKTDRVKKKMKATVPTA